MSDIFPGKQTVNGAFEIIDASRLFLMITPGRLLGTTTDTTTQYAALIMKTLTGTGV